MSLMSRCLLCAREWLEWFLFPCCHFLLVTSWKLWWEYKSVNSLCTALMCRFSWKHLLLLPHSGVWKPRHPAPPAEVCSNLQRCGADGSAHPVVLGSDGVLLQYGEVPFPQVCLGPYTAPSHHRWLQGPRFCGAGKEKTTMHYGQPVCPFIHRPICPSICQLWCLLEINRGGGFILCPQPSFLTICCFSFSYLKSEHWKYLPLYI